MRGYEPRGREFESLRVRHKNNHLQPFENFILRMNPNPLNELGSQGDKSTTWAVVWRLFSVREW